MTASMKRKQHAAIPAAILILALLLSLLPVTVWADSVPASSNTFTFTDGGITASDAGGSGFKIDGTALTINESGVYTVTGSCSDGSIKVKKETTGVTLILQDLSLAASDTAPLSCNKQTETTLYILGTVTLTDKEDPADEDSTDEAVADAFEGAAIKVKSGASLTVTGSGTLYADGSACKNGIKGAALSTITVDGATLNITAANHGLASDHLVTVNGGTLVIKAGNEGIKASPDEDDAESAGDIVINGGSVTVTAADDGIHAEGNLAINGGSVTVSAGDDGLKAEYDVTIDGGEIRVVKSVEGIEGATVNLKSGSGSVTASDDGINAANSDLSGYAFELNISGGTWYVDAIGDGLDSNGTISISGGDTQVFGAANNGNGTLDSERGITFTGGSVLAVGMSGMAESPSGTCLVFGSGGMGGQMPGNMSGQMNGQMNGQMGGQMDGQMPGDMDGQMNGSMGGQMPDNMGGQMGGQMAGDMGGRMNGSMGGQMPGNMSGRMSGSMGGQMPGNMSGQMNGEIDGQMNGQMPNEMSGELQLAQGTGTVNLSAGDTLTIRDSAGNTLCTATAVRSANSVIYASSALVSGETYSLYVNGAETATATAGEGGGMAGGMPGNMGGQMNGNMGGQMPGNTQNSGQIPAAPSGTAPAGSSAQNGGQVPATPSGSTTPAGNAQNGGQVPATPSGSTTPAGNAQNGGQVPATPSGSATPAGNAQNGGQTPATPSGSAATDSTQNSAQTSGSDEDLAFDSGDAPDAWALDTVLSAIRTGLVNRELRHNYTGQITRGEAAQMFIQLIELVSGENIDSFLAEKGLTVSGNAFPDTDDRYVLAANALGLIQGRDDGSFDPGAALKRAEITAILNRAARVLGVDTSGYSHSFSDVQGHWVSGELGWAAANGVIQGRDGGVFDPDASVTTQEAIAITFRALGVLDR